MADTNAEDGSRRRFRRRRRGTDEDDSADLSEPEHAWWAAREEIFGTAADALANEQARRDDEAEDAADGSPVYDYWSPESLYNAPISDDPFQDDLDGRSPHKVLGLSDEATWDEISARHRRLAKKYHPDRWVGATDEQREDAERQMQQINVAYAELQRANRRAPL